MADTDSILGSIKTLLGGAAANSTIFDQDIIIHINTSLRILNQLGVGVDNFTVSDDTAVWTDFVSEGELDEVRTYVYLRVKSVFDPPTSSIVADASKRTMDELEWRMNVTADEWPMND